MKALLLPCALFFLVCVAASACRSTSSHDDEKKGFDNLTRGYDSGIEEHGLVVARTEAEWESLWARHTSRVVFKIDRPHVDWSRDMVIGVLLGEKKTAGFGVRIESVSSADGKLVVKAMESKPAPDAFVPQIVTRPYQFVVVPHSTLPIELELH